MPERSQDWYKPVSYTHLDVYKRQMRTYAGCGVRKQDTLDRCQ